MTLQLADAIAQTVASKKTLDPVFDDSLPLALTAQGPATLVVTVFDKDMTSSDFIGEVTLDLCALFDSSGGWLEGSVSGEYPFADPNEQLGGSERKQMEQRLAAGITRPAGTVSLRLKFTPDAAQMRAKLDAEAAAAAAVAVAEAKASRDAEAKYLKAKAAKAAAAVAADAEVKLTVVAAQAERVAHLIRPAPDDPGSTQQLPPEHRASPDIHKSSGQVRARKSTVRRLPSMSMTGIAEAALGKKFATANELRATKLEKDRASRRAAKLAEERARVAAAFVKELAFRAEDVPDYESRDKRIVPIDYLVEYRKSASSQQQQKEGEEALPWTKAVVNCQATCLARLRRPDELRALAKECAQIGGTTVADSGTDDGVVVRVVDYADPYFETDRVRFARALALLPSVDERIAAVEAHRELFFKQTQKVYLEDLVQMKRGTVWTAAQCWEGLQDDRFSETEGEGEWERNRWKETAAAILHYKLTNRGMKLRKDWTELDGHCVALQAEACAVDAAVERSVDGRERIELRSRARQLREEVIADLRTDCLVQLGVRAEDLLDGVLGDGAGQDLARELLQELRAVGGYRLLENDSRQRLDSGKGVRKADLLETQQLLAQVVAGLRTFLGGSHSHTRKADVLLASSFCYPSLPTAPLDDLRTARQHFERLVDVRHAELTAEQEATAVRKEFMALRMIPLQSEIKKVQQFLDYERVDAAYGLDDTNDIKAELTQLLMEHLVCETAKEDGETLEYCAEAGAITAEIKQRQHVTTLLDGLRMPMDSLEVDLPISAVSDGCEEPGGEGVDGRGIAAAAVSAG